MRLEDRLKFREGAKKAELSSIFENKVWHLGANPDSVDPSRVMKARFVLKRAGDGNGSLRAKARLVLQGLSDPDLLNGELDTSSPTLGPGKIFPPGHAFPDESADLDGNSG